MTIERSKLQVIHGGHKGAEAEFGRAAEKWGVVDTTISFEGHKMERAHNVDQLSDELLEKGHVSMEFVFQRMNRRFARGKGLRRVIYSMFHVVTQSKTLFAVGRIQDDNTVKGGTGWGVELAKVFNREVHVFCQDKHGWFHWEGASTGWRPSEPTLPEGKFSATGTRNLTDEGKRAIHALFERSLGAA